MRYSREEFNQKFKYLNQTPMMKQYLDIKFEHQDTYLLFRMGDFYELFFEDAEKISKILGIALAKRGKIEGEDISMCGVPFHAIDNYLPRLLEHNLKVAICEQLESPQEAKIRDGNKAVVNRDVVRIITPGTVIEESVLQANRPSFLTSIVTDKDNISICYLDITTGEFGVSNCDNSQDLSSLLDSYNPKEIILKDEVFIKFKEIFEPYAKKLVFQPDIYFSNKRASDNIESFYEIESFKALGDLNNSSISAIGAVIQYIKLTQKTNIPKLSYPKIFDLTKYISLDPATRKSLEIVSSNSGVKGSSLIDVIDKTSTSSGGRKLYSYLINPLKDLNEILHRQDYVNLFFEEQKIRINLRHILSNMSDMERALNKILMRRCSPVDMASLKYSLSTAVDIKDLFYNEYGVKIIPEKIENLIKQLDFDYSVLDEINECLRENVNSNMSEGGFINPNCHPRLYELDELIKNSRFFVNKLKEKYQQSTGIETLKINHNNILGLYVEVSQKNSPKIPSELFNYRQSTSTAVRFSTDELDELHSKIVNAQSLMIAIENDIFEKLCSKVDDNFQSLKNVADTISEIDVYLSLAQIAKERDFVRPKITDDNKFFIEGGRHPSVEYFLSKKQQNFIKNDCYFDNSQSIILLTGPNMGGKSTFLRQNAIIILLAQIGSFVPADSASISVVDRIFSRVGSGDDLSTGKSTFMVEMIETSMILNQATEKSFIIFDEVGRGTSTHDGVSIAWSILEYLHDVKKSNTIFATHYHELTELANNHLRLNNYSVASVCESDRIKFLHKIVKGPVSNSYGIEVAKIAGIPSKVIARAEKVLLHFEKIYQKKTSESKRKELYSLSLFDKNDTSKSQEIINKISNIEVENITGEDMMEYLKDIVKDAKSLVKDS